MGILTDFIIAKDHDAAAIGEAIRPADHWPTLEFKGIDTIKVATLHSAITGEPYSDELHDSFAMVSGNAEEGPWVFRYPSNALNALSSLSDDQVLPTATAWTATEELQLDGWTQEDAAAVIRELSTHAKQALSSQASLFLWISL